MKKAILALILIAVLGCGAYFGYTFYMNLPEQAIVGRWNNDKVDALYYVFNKDGTMSGQIEILSATVGLEGTYEINGDDSTLTITYQLKSSLLSFGTDYTVKKAFEFTKDGKLILTDEDGNVSTFTKAEQ